MGTLMKSPTLTDLTSVDIMGNNNQGEDKEREKRFRQRERNKFSSSVREGEREKRKSTHADLPFAEKCKHSELGVTSSDIYSDN